jgi:uncharacterized protein YlxW (UPF0749 family)
VDLAILPTFGVAGALIVVIGYLLASNRADRTQHREVVTALTSQHQGERESFERRIKDLETRVRDLESEVDAEKDRRRHAEDEAAEAKRRALAVEAEVLVLKRNREGSPGD